MLQKSICFIALISSLSTYGQKLKKADKSIIDGLHSHISFLADDKLEGRRAGTRGEKFAREYITNQFQQAGLQPMGDANGWYQMFEINDGKELNKNSYFTINGEELKKDGYFPLLSDAGNLVEAAPAISLHESGSAWFLNLKDTLEGNKTNPHFDVKAYITAQVKEAASKGATALLVYNTGTIEDGLAFDPREKTSELKIPVIYISKKMAEKHFSDESATMDIKFKITLDEKKRIGNNVIGFLNNKAENTIIIGAHYDHLGFGEDNNSLYKGGAKMVHNGADDNASGTAALLELSKLLKNSNSKNNNYIFIAFSGEELGLFGSKYFSEHPSIDLNKVNYMINLDMVGRLNDTTKTLTVGGYGTSPWWGQLFNSIGKGQFFTTKYDSSGSGPSDHTSFYRKNIPVLFLFTGLHSDYHRPTDDYNKINYIGTYRIIKYVETIIDQTNNKGKLAFSKTHETSISSTARFSVTLGILPDYTFSGGGVRVDGVSDNRPAQQAGIKAGDIIIQLGDNAVTSIENYMQALSKFKKGDKTAVVYKRGAENLKADIQF